MLVRIQPLDMATSSIIIGECCSNGELTEWFIVPVLKTGDLGNWIRGFKSYILLKGSPQWTEVIRLENDEVCKSMYELDSRGFRKVCGLCFINKGHIVYLYIIYEKQIHKGIFRTDCNWV